MKNGDLPMKNGDSPIKNGDLPIKHMVFFPPNQRSFPVDIKPVVSPGHGDDVGPPMDRRQVPRHVRNALARDGDRCYGDPTSKNDIKDVIYIYIWYMILFVVILY